MTEYESKVYEEIQVWRKQMRRQPSPFKQVSKKVQNKVNGMIPYKVHQFIAEAIKNMVRTILFGSSLTTDKVISAGMHLDERDDLLKEKLSTYRKTAVAEGAGTGAGGVFIGLTDFPLLLSIKIKFLFEAAAIYGFYPDIYEERLFMLHVFQLAFSSDDKQRETLRIIENWEEAKEALVDMDWHVFQQEYRDYIDLVKLLQLIPGFGAIVGAYANYNLLDQLGETAMNAYRIRYMKL